MSSESHIAILILAAGGSRRMGEPKQLLKWKNTDLVNHAIETSSQIDSSQIYLVLGSDAKLIRAGITDKNVTFIINEHWEEGIGSSISSGVKAVKKSNPSTNGILIMLSDQPLINHDYLNRMVTIWQEGTHQIVASDYADGKFGVPALFGDRYFNALEKLSDDRGAKIIIKKNFEDVTGLNARDMILDIDTPEDYAKLRDINHQS